MRGRTYLGDAELELVVGGAGQPAAVPVLEAHRAAHPDGGPERVRAAAAHVFVRAALPGPGGELARVEPGCDVMRQRVCSGERGTGGASELGTHAAMSELEYTVPRSAAREIRNQHAVKRT